MESRRSLIVLLLALAVGSAAVPAFAQGRNTRNQSDATENFERNYKVASGASLVVSNVSGAIRITSGGGGEIAVRALKHASNSRGDAAQIVAGTNITASATANRVELRVESNRNNQRNNNVASVDFDIRVPADCAVDLHSVSGNISVSKVGGELRAEAVSGDIVLESTSHIAFAKSVSGNIRMTSSGGDASAIFETVSGDLTANGLTAHTLEFKTVSGTGRLTDATVERMTFRSVSGDLEYAGSLAPRGRYDLETHSGNIRLTLADQPGFEVDANTFSGEITIDFSIRNEGPVRTRGNTRQPNVRGTFGDASASLHLQTFSGNIRVRKR